MSTTTPYQMLAEVARVTGKHIHLRPYDRVLKVGLPADVTVYDSTWKVTVLLERYVVRETRAADVLTGRNLVLMAWSLADGIGLVYEEVVIPDSTFVQTRHENWTTAYQHERQAKRLWETECGRPGVDRRGAAPIQAERERAYFTSVTV